VARLHAEPTNWLLLAQLKATQTTFSIAHRSDRRNCCAHAECNGFTGEVIGLTSPGHSPPSTMFPHRPLERSPH